MHTTKDIRKKLGTSKDGVCANPKCSNLAFMAFFYEQGYVLACLDCYKETATEFEEYHRGNK